MNQQRRNNIRQIISVLENQKFDLEQLIEEENEARENLPENLNGSSKYEAMELVEDQMIEAADQLDDLIDKLLEIIEV